MNELIWKSDFPELFSLGLMIGICEQNDAYLTWNVHDFRRLFMPPIQNMQFAIFFFKEKPVGFATWGSFSEDLHKYIIRFRVDPRIFEWNSGPYFWLMDFVCQREYVHQMSYSLKNSVIPAQCLYSEWKNIGFGSALRRNSDGTVRKISILTNRI